MAGLSAERYLLRHRISVDEVVVGLGTAAEDVGHLDRNNRLFRRTCGAEGGQEIVDQEVVVTVLYSGRRTSGHTHLEACGIEEEPAQQAAGASVLLF